MSADGTVTLHSLADEPLTIRPVSSMSVYIEALEYYSSSWWDFHIDDSPGVEKKDCPCGCRQPIYQAPGPVLVAPAAPDGTVVTIGDYVKQPHAWFNDHEEEIRLALLCGYEDRGLDFMVVDIPEEPSSIEFEFEDNGPEDIPKIWEQRARHTREYIEISALYK